MSSLFLSLLLSIVCLHPESADSLRMVELDEVSVVGDIKENGSLRQLSVSATIVDKDALVANHANSLKGISHLSPNLFMPEYGSRLTSAMYIRGIGSRMNTPAVGLYVDNIPYVDKSAFDFNLQDIERIDVLRGPQGVLYGRNTMGGLLRVYTKNPMYYYSGTDVHLGYATADNHRTVSATRFQHINPQMAFSIGGYYDGGDGFFRNSLTGKKVDKNNAAGGRFRGVYWASDRLAFDLTASYDYSDEGAYPYFFTGSLTDPDYEKASIGTICNNRESSYRRGMFNTGLNIEYKAPQFVMNAVTGYQHLNDRMFMDQDFISLDTYTLEQKQRINTINEEVTFKNRNEDGWYSWLTGVNVMYQTLHTDGPVTFYEDGVGSLIEGNTNRIFEELKNKNPKMPTMGIAMQDREFVVSSLMDTPTLDFALFHNSTFKWNRWKFTAGLRLEYESLRLKYFSDSDITFDFNIKMSPMVTMPYPNLKASPVLDGKMNDGYLQVLPKVSAMYQLPEGGNVYASVSKGYRSGGYNVQMFSDILQGEMRSEMITSINDAGKGAVEKMMGEDAYQRLIAKSDVSSVVYKPEYSWNYEGGTHLTFGSRTNRLSVDAALFYSRIFDQQIARFAPTGLGRMMVNAGKSQSYGAEMSARWTARYTNLNALAFAANYGYTRATFLEYEDGRGNDYKDKYVPFVPQHNVNLDGQYTLFLAKYSANPFTCFIRSVSFGANVTGAGRIYWTEDNSVSQPFYATLGARVALESLRFSVVLWGKNLTNTHYNTFYFESAGRGFEQHCRPLQFGVDVNLHI